MTDHTGLIRRLRHRIWDYMTPEQELMEEAADAIEKFEAALLRIGHPGKVIAYCRDGHEENVLIARAALGEKTNA